MPFLEIDIHCICLHYHNNEMSTCVNFVHCSPIKLILSIFFLATRTHFAGIYFLPYRKIRHSAVHIQRT